MTLMSLRAAVSAVVLAGCAAAMTGCGINPETALSSSPETGAAHPFGGSAFGGQQPISGAHVYVYATGTSGYGNGSTSLLNAGSARNGTTYGQDSNKNTYLITDSSGNYYVNTINCSAGTQAYVYIIGGNPGGGDNSAAGLMAPLGPCAAGIVNPPNVDFVNTNEITTVVAAYTLAGYATGPTAISSGGSNLAANGLTNASNTALNIVNIGTGFIPASTTVTGGATIPVAEIYTLASALSACVNSTGPSSTPCKTLLGDTGTTDTASAAIAIAHTPFANTSDLFTLGTQGTPVFSPTLGTKPTDFTLALQYPTAQYQSNASAGSSSYVHNYSLAVDSVGNLWTRGTNDNGGNSTTTFAKYSPLGSPILAPTAVTNNTAYSTYFADNPYVHVGIDGSDQLWSGIPGGEVIVSSTGTVTSTTVTACSGLKMPISTVFGATGIPYVGDYANSKIWQFSASSSSCASGLSNPNSGLFTGYLATTPGGAIVASGSYNSANYDYLYTPGTGFGTPFRAGGDFVSTDKSGDIFGFSTVAANSANDSLNEYFPTAYTGNPQTFYNGGLTQTGYNSYRAGVEGVHVDGAGSVWVGVCPNGCSSATPLSDIIVGMTSTGAGITPATGLTLPYGETGAYALAPDGSGNLWVALKDGSLMQFVGLSKPVATPILPANVGVTP